ncbi:MAG: class I SAM-dependent methyltransferase family protein [Thermoplasmata archaeon]|nr:class I SAM-dependent methyltransferase family protein [Thermoplasmata archaeon]
MVRERGSPVERARRRVRAQHGEGVAEALPDGFQRVGSVVVLRLPERLRPAFPAIGKAYRDELGASAVLRHRGPASGERRLPSLEFISRGATETEVREHGVRFQLDVARVMFSRGNEIERARAGRLTRPGETVLDLFAGIGYFVLPALVVGRAARAYAVEENPDSYRYLVANLALNGVEDRADALLGDNRTVPLPPRSADRVFLGLLPSAVPWIPRAMSLAKPGATLHVHLVVDANGDLASGEQQVARAVDSAGGALERSSARRVKAYGPGRSHVVVDATVTPPAA